MRQILDDLFGIFRLASTRLPSKNQQVMQGEQCWQTLTSTMSLYILSLNWHTNLDNGINLMG